MQRSILALGIEANEEINRKLCGRLLGIEQYCLNENKILNEMLTLTHVLNKDNNFIK